MVFSRWVLTSITYWVERDDSSGWWAFFVTMALLAILYFFGAKNEIITATRFIVSNPMSVLLAAFLYFFFGTVWSMVKWALFVKSKRSDYLDDLRRNNEWKPRIVPRNPSK